MKAADRSENERGETDSGIYWRQIGETEESENKRDGEGRRGEVGKTQRGGAEEKRRKRERGMEWHERASCERKVR